MMNIESGDKAGLSFTSPQVIRRRFIAEDNSYKRDRIPSLKELCSCFMADNFEFMTNDYMKLDPNFQEDLHKRLSENIPVQISLAIIDDEEYWKRCFLNKFDIYMHESKNKNWKKAFCERFLQNIIEKCESCDFFDSHVEDFLKILANYIEKLNFSLLKVSKLKQDLLISNMAKTIEFCNKLKSIEISIVPQYDFNDFKWKTVDIDKINFIKLSKSLALQKSLSSLTITRSNLTSEHTKILLESRINTLVELNLSFNFIDDESGLHLKSIISQNRDLKILDIESNYLRSFAVKKILIPLNDGKSGLEELYLGQNKIMDEGAFSLSEMLRTNKYLKKLSINNCSITSKGASVLCDSLIENESLVWINVSNNSLEEENGPLFCKLMQNSKSLQYIDVRLCGFNLKDEFFIMNTSTDYINNSIKIIKSEFSSENKV